MVCEEDPSNWQRGSRRLNESKIVKMNVLLCLWLPQRPHFYLCRLEDFDVSYVHCPNQRWSSGIYFYRLFWTPLQPTPYFAYLTINISNIQRWKL